MNATPEQANGATGSPDSPPISHAGSVEVSPRHEPSFQQYASFLRRSLEPAVDDWSHDELAAMLLRELSYAANGPTANTDAIAHFRQSQKRAKRAIETKEDVHPELARAIYYVSLARAWIEHGVWITSLTRGEVGEGLAYARKCKWVENDSGIVSRLADLTKRLSA